MYFSPHSSFRPPNWRALRAEYLVKHGESPVRRGDDQWVRVAWRFFRALSRSEDERYQQRVRRCRLHLATAVELWEDADTFSRAEMEARILAREPIGTVAKRFGLAPKALEAYTAIYFDVLNKLDATNYIVLQVVGLTPSRRFSEKDVDVWLKYFGYAFGPYILDSLIDYYANPEPIPKNITEVDPSRRRRVILHLTIRASILGRCVPDGDPRSVDLSEISDRTDAVKRSGMVIDAVTAKMSLAFANPSD